MTVGLRRTHALALRELVKRDLQSRYAGSLFGFLWSFVQPLWQIVLFSFVFSTVLGVRASGDGGSTSFAMFLFCGLLPWQAIQEGVLRSATAITDNANLVKKLRFPAEILVISMVLVALINELIAGAVFGVVLAATGALDWRHLPLLLAALPLQIALTVGLGLLLASVQVFVRDVTQITNIVLGAWFYLTPIVYPIRYVPERFRSWIEWNPLSGLVGLYRGALIGDASTSWAGLASLVGAAVLSLAVGVWMFSRLKPAFVDEV
jgi:lipopolysaccharide transport system permease protein